MVIRQSGVQRNECRVSNFLTSLIKKEYFIGFANSMYNETARKRTWKCIVGGDAGVQFKIL